MKRLHREAWRDNRDEVFAAGQRIVDALVAGAVAAGVTRLV